MGSVVEIVAYDSNRGRLERQGNPALSDLLYNELGLPYLRLTMQEPRKLSQVWISARHAQQGGKNRTEVRVTVNTTPTVIRFQGTLRDMPRLMFSVTFTVTHHNPSDDYLIGVADWAKLQHEEVEVVKSKAKVASSKTLTGAPQEYIDLRRKELEAIAEQAATSLLSTIKKLQEKDSA